MSGFLKVGDDSLPGLIGHFTAHQFVFVVLQPVKFSFLDLLKDPRCDLNMHVNFPFFLLHLWHRVNGRRKLGAEVLDVALLRVHEFVFGLPHIQFFVDIGADLIKSFQGVFDQDLV